MSVQEPAVLLRTDALDDLVAEEPDTDPSYTSLRTLAETYLDLQETRKATSNRLNRAAINQVEAKALLAGLVESEKEIARSLHHEYRRVAPPGVQQWVKDSKGIGEHSVALLLGYTGHPRWQVRKEWVNNEVGVEVDGKVPKRILRYLGVRPRSIAQLRAFCGHGSPDLIKIPKGATQEEIFARGHPRCKVIVHQFLATACVIHGERYRAFYDDRKVRYQTNHPEWTPGHQNNAAIRALGKEILKDLWIASA